MKNLLIKNLSCSLSGKQILDDISLNLPAGKITALLGPSGCGKTTFLKCIAGLLPIDRGEIYLGSQEISKLAAEKRKTVVVFQDLRLFPHMTVAQNVAFPLKMQGLKRKERRAKAEELLAAVQLNGLADRKSDKLSGGQMQRVALARALAADPEVLLLDEPFSSLDENLREDMRRMILNLQKEFAISTILVTHDRKEALAMAENIALIFDGRVEEFKSSREIYQSPDSRKTAEYFGGGSYIKGSVSNGVFRAFDFDFKLNLGNNSYADGNYRLYLRQENLSLAEAGENCDLKMRVAALQYQGDACLAELRGPGDFKINFRLPADSKADELSLKIKSRNLLLFSEMSSNNTDFAIARRKSFKSSFF